MTYLPYNDDFNTFVIVFNIFTSLSGFIQFYKIYKKKTSQGVSIFAWSVGAAGDIVLIFWSLTIDDYLVILLSSIISALGAILTILITIEYDYKEMKHSIHTDNHIDKTVHPEFNKTLKDTIKDVEIIVEIKNDNKKPTLFELNYELPKDFNPLLDL